MSQTIQEAIETLRKHNDWRRDNTGAFPQQNAIAVGEAIDTLLAHVTKPVPEDVKERAEELFDKYSIFIEDSSFDFSNVSETSIVQRKAFERAIVQVVSEYSKGYEQRLAEKDALIEERATGFAEWIQKKEYWRNVLGTWCDREEVAESTSDLFKLYLQQIEAK